MLKGWEDHRPPYLFCAPQPEGCGVQKAEALPANGSTSATTAGETALSQGA